MPYILQKYVDKSGDIQTAAYISAYAYTLKQQISKKMAFENEEKETPEQKA